jgi:hypothetical protein
MGLLSPSYQNSTRPEISLLKPDKRLQRSFEKKPSPTLANYISTSQTIIPTPVIPKRKYNKTDKWDQRHGPPEGRSVRGRYTWRRAFDGRMVTVNCTVVGCPKKEGSSFRTLHGFLCHMSKEHRIKFEGREDLLQRCGDVADMGESEEQMGTEENGERVVNGQFGNTTLESVEMQVNDDLGESQEMLGDPSGVEEFGRQKLSQTPIVLVPAASQALVISSDGSEEPQTRTQPSPDRIKNQLIIRVTDIDNNMNMMNASDIFHPTELRASVEANTNIKEEIVTPHVNMDVPEDNSNSEMSSLFGNGSFRNASREQTMDVDETGKAQVEMNGAGMMGDMVRETVTPEDERIARLLGGISGSALDALF